MYFVFTNLISRERLLFRDLDFFPNYKFLREFLGVQYDSLVVLFEKFPLYFISFEYIEFVETKSITLEQIFFSCHQSYNVGTYFISWF